MLTTLWVIWLVVMCLTTLLGIFRPSSALLKPLSAFLVVGVAGFVVWLTEGRIVAFMLLGVALAFAGLLVVTAVPAAGGFRIPRARLPVLMRALRTPSLVLGALVGTGIELGGRWSGSQFVVWRAFVGGGLVLLIGVGFVARAMRAQSPT